MRVRLSKPAVAASLAAFSFLFPAAGSLRAAPTPASAQTMVYAAHVLLAAAPWVFALGNHELCSHAGPGGSTSWRCG